MPKPPEKIAAMSVGWPSLEQLDVVILAGGLGTRLREETDIRPKPMVEIGDRPILWHIMKIYARYGVKNFIICLGYKGHVIRDYFLNYRHHQSDIAVDLASNDIEVLNPTMQEDWRVVLADTGRDANTGARIKRVLNHLRHDVFLATYGDGVSDVDIRALYHTHQEGKRGATVTAVHPEARFGEIALSDGAVREFVEKPQTGSGWINGGFFVFDRNVFEVASEASSLSLEHDVLTQLAASRQLSAYEHRGFWQCVDTYREMLLLNELWRRGTVPWLDDHGR